jgi:hypothetical protein
MAPALNTRQLLLPLLVLCLTYQAGTASVDDEGNSTSYEHDEALTEDALSNRNTNDIFQRAVQKAIGGGIPGAIAGLVQVLTLMWLVSFLEYYFFL